MSTQHQSQQVDISPRKSKGRRQLRKFIILVVVIIALILTTIWILSDLGIIPGSWATISSIIVTILGAVFTFFQLLHLLVPPDKSEPPGDSILASPASSVPVDTASKLYGPSIMLQAIQHQPLSALSPFLQKTAHRGITGIPPPTDLRSIEQRVKVVREIYKQLSQPDLTGVVLTGIGGIGKSTLAALIYLYVGEQLRNSTGPFAAQPIWLRVDPAVTMTDLVGSIFEALNKPLPDLGGLSPQSQALMLFNALNSTDKPRLIVLDQFENLLDWRTGFALADRPGVGEWLDAINSQSCICKVLLTSRLFPLGTREHPPIHLQEYRVGGLEGIEGINLLRKQGVEEKQATEAELRKAVEICEGHALALILLASILRRNHSLNLGTILNDTGYAQFWKKNAARSLLDHIFMKQLDEIQRQLLLAFSVYREPVPLDAARIVMDSDMEVSEVQVLSALDLLLMHHLLQATGKGHYQLHSIIVDYTHDHFYESNEPVKQQMLKVAHTKAADYYLRQAITSCPPREKRQQISDVHPLIEVIWHNCHARRYQEALSLFLEEGLFRDLNRWGGYAVLFELCRLLLPSNTWHPDRQNEALVYTNLGLTYNALGQKRRAIEHFEHALQIYKEIEYHKGEGWVLSNLGWVNDDLGRKEEALFYYKQALRIRREVGDRRGEGTTLNGLAWLYRGLGEKDVALKYFQQALGIRKKVKDRRGEGESLNGMGLVYADLGEIDKALCCYEQSLLIRREVGDLNGEGRTLNNLGLVYADLEECERARGYYERSLNIRREIGDRIGEAMVLYNIGKLHFKQSKYEIALACFLLAKGVFDEVQNPNREATQSWIGRVAEKVGKESFATLLAEIGPQAYKVVERAIKEEVE